MESTCGCNKKSEPKPRRVRDDGDNFWQHVVEKYRRRKCKMERREIDLQNRLQAMENQMPMLLMMSVMKQVQDSLPANRGHGKMKKDDAKRVCKCAETIKEYMTDTSNVGHSSNVGDHGTRSVDANTQIDCSCSGGQISIKTLDSTDVMCVQALHMLTSNERSLQKRISELEEQEAALVKVIEEATTGLSFFEGPSPTALDELKRRNEELAKENRLLRERQNLLAEKYDETCGLSDVSKRLGSAIKECEASCRRA